MNSVKSVAENTLISIPTFSELARTRAAPGTFVKISRQSAFALSLVLLLALVGPRTRGQASGAPSRGPTQQELNTAASDTRNWLYATHDYADQKFVDLKQINADNVKNLRPVCMYQAPENSTAQANPIVYQNTMYVTTGHLTIALNATDCSVRWMSKWIPKRAEAMPQNRGAAICSLTSKVATLIAITHLMTP